MTNEFTVSVLIVILSVCVIVSIGAYIADMASKAAKADNDARLRREAHHAIMRKYKKLSSRVFK